MKTFIILLFIIPGALIYLLGKYIKKTGYVEVLKSYNENLNYDKDGLTNYSSKLMIYTGLVTILLSILSFVFTLVLKNDNIKSYFLIVYVVVTIHYVIKLRLSCKKFILSKTEDVK